MPPKFVDIDGHIMEPSHLWLDYIDPESRGHALKISKDENGLEQLPLDGKKSFFGRGGALGPLGAIGKDVTTIPGAGAHFLGLGDGAGGIPRLREGEGYGLGADRHYAGLSVVGAALGV